MDRRQQKTRKAIFCAFRALLQKKRYEYITVQEIIDAADVGRSTFYAHFETKDLLLDTMCSEMFFHVFENDPCPWAGKDNDLQAKLAHTLWHVKENEKDLSGILFSTSGELFADYFKKYLSELFNRYSLPLGESLPKGFLLNHLSASFVETVKWWLAGGCRESSEQIAEYYCKVNALV